MSSGLSAENVTFAFAFRAAFSMCTAGYLPGWMAGWLAGGENAACFFAWVLYAELKCCLCVCGRMYHFHVFLQVLYA